MERIHGISLSHITKDQIIKAIIVVALAVLMGVLNIIVKHIASPLKPNAGRDISMVAIKYDAAIHKLKLETRGM
jgi:hypothetical protein